MFGLDAKKRIASDSRDHIVCGGTMMDDTCTPEFLHKCYSLFQLEKDKRSFALLDLGCSSGRQVEQVINEGHFACGLEGSDYSLARQRSSWGRIPHNLFVCDITEPFVVYSKKVTEHLNGDPTYTMYLHDSLSRIVDTYQPFRFDVITIFEVFEHIGLEKLDQLMRNILRHLMPDGYVMLSVSMQEGYHHRTIQTPSWWKDLFRKHGLENDDKVCALIGDDWPRGPKEPCSFNLALRRSNFFPETA